MAVGTHDKTISRLPFLFIIMGMIGFFLFHIFSILSLMGWLENGLRGPTGWFQVHLFVLGWATMLAMGAVYQLINVILQSDMYNNTLGYVHFILFTIGLSGLLFGFHGGDVEWIAVFATLTFLGIVLFVWNMAMTLFRSKQWNSITLSAGFAVLYLFLTGLSGMIMGVDFATGWFIDWHESLFGAHIWLGTVGWFGLLITGFSYKMLPMFYLSHHYPTRLQSVVLWLWNASVVVGVCAFLFDAGTWGIWAALLLLTSAVSLYFIHMLQIRKAKHKKNPGQGIRWSLVINALFVAAAVIGTIISAVNPEQTLAAKPVMIAGWTYLAGWVSFNILCYASKIVPFLWWTHKYGKQIGKPGTPMMAELLDDDKVNIGLAITLFALFLLLAGLVVEWPVMIVSGGLAFSIASIAYIVLISSVFAK